MTLPISRDLQSLIFYISNRSMQAASYAKPGFYTKLIFREMAQRRNAFESSPLAVSLPSCSDACESLFRRCVRGGCI